LTRTNTPAYFEVKSMMKKKSGIVCLSRQKGYVQRIVFWAWNICWHSLVQTLLLILRPYLASVTSKFVFTKLFMIFLVFLLRKSSEKSVLSSFFEYPPWACIMFKQRNQGRRGNLVHLVLCLQLIPFHCMAKMEEDQL